MTRKWTKSSAPVIVCRSKKCYRSSFNTHHLLVAESVGLIALSEGTGSILYFYWELRSLSSQQPYSNTPV